MVIESSDQQKALQSLKQLFSDDSIPAAVRAQLKNQYASVQQLIEKLEKQQIHIVAFGKVSTGKSSLLNALLGSPHFDTSPLHGETKHNQPLDWQSMQQQSIVLIDTPGTDEFDGEAREQMAKQAAKQADIVLFLLAGDISDSELKQLNFIASPEKVVLLVLNKADLYSGDEINRILTSVQEKTRHLNVRLITASADPRPETVVVIQRDGSEHRQTQQAAVDIKALKSEIWDILEKEGKTLSALNASLFATDINRQVAENIVQLRAKAAQKIIKTYCLAKGIGVACNPIPVADLLLAAGIDVAMIRQLSTLYGLQLGKTEAAKLTATIMAQLALLMGAVWGVNLLSSALKTLSAGLSTTLTASAQGALGYYATYLVGQIASEYFAQGNTWGDDGPKALAKNIVQKLDRQSILQDASEQIMALLNNKKS